MDTIKFIITDAYDTHIAAKAIDVILFLNDKQVPHGILNLPEVLAANKFKFAEFDLYTCSCGVPGCAGFQAPVVQSISKDMTIWNFPLSGDYKTDKNVYEFETTDFLLQFNGLLENLIELEKVNVYHTVLIPTDYGDEYSHLEDPCGILKSFEWYKDRYQAEQDLHELLLSYPLLVDKIFAFSYGGYTGKLNYNLSSLVGKILNEYPTHPNDTVYLDKCKEAIQVIEYSIIGKNNSLQELASQAYEKNGLSAFNLIDWDFEGLTEESFDLKKLSIILTPP